MYVTKYIMAGFQVAYYDHPKKDPIPTVLRERPDIISTGIIMPELDGFALTKILKADSRTKAIPIMGLDNLGQDADIQKAHELGMADYLVMAKHTPAEVVERACELLHLPKPVFDKLSATNPTPLTNTKRSWWNKFFR